MQNCCTVIGYILLKLDSFYRDPPHLAKCHSEMSVSPTIHECRIEPGPDQSGSAGGGVNKGMFGVKMSFNQPYCKSLDVTNDITNYKVHHLSHNSKEQAFLTLFEGQRRA